MASSGNQKKVNKKYCVNKKNQTKNQLAEGTEINVRILKLTFYRWISRGFDSLKSTSTF